MAQKINALWGSGSSTGWKGLKVIRIGWKIWKAFKWKHFWWKISARLQWSHLMTVQTPTRKCIAAFSPLPSGRVSISQCYFKSVPLSAISAAWLLPGMVLPWHNWGTFPGDCGHLHNCSLFSGYTEDFRVVSPTPSVSTNFTLKPSLSSCNAFSSAKVFWRFIRRKSKLWKFSFISSLCNDQVEGLD